VIKGLKRPAKIINDIKKSKKNIFEKIIRNT
jgi:hypothetical protein